MEIEEIMDEADEAAEGKTEAAETDDTEAAETEPEEQVEDEAIADDPEADDASDGQSDPVEDDDVQAAFDRGVLAERERIAEIMCIAGRVPDDMVQAALFTEPISAEQLALQAMKAEDAQRAGYMEKARADIEASKSSKVAAEVTDATDADSKSEQKQMLEKALADKFSK